MNQAASFPEGQMPAWGLTTVDDATEPGCDLVRRWLREHNWKVNPDFMQEMQQPEHRGRPLIVLARAASAVIGGLIAETQLSWLRISLMAVDPEWRSQGIGTSLFIEAERLAIARGCRYAYVDTMDYQAPDFYVARGFQIVGEIPDWDSHGHRKLYLTKRMN